MNEPVLIASFHSQSELSIARSKLESENIECLVEDELTVQSYNFISYAIGGIKLFVAAAEYDLAYQILLDGGFISEKSNEQSRIDRILENPRNLKTIKVFFWGFITLCAVFCVYIIWYLMISFPTDADRLVNYNWCLDHFQIDDQVYYSNTTYDKPTLLFFRDCSEKIDFQINEQVLLPGLNTPVFVGNWSLIEDKLLITVDDSLGSIYNQEFWLDFDKGMMTLSSDSVTIICYKTQF